MCWICGAPADSAEHRIKKADLVRAYGSGPYRGPCAPAHFRNGVVTAIQGPSSVKVRYLPSLCHGCNTAGTQPYDQAYDRLISWILENEPLVLKKRFINFKEVYGTSFEEGQRALFKYFVKSFGCRLVDAGASVPQDLIDLFPQKAFRTGLKITFSVNEDILLFPEDTRSSFIGKGDLGVSCSKTDRSDFNGYFWSEHVSWFTIFYWYNMWPEGDLGSTWIANAQYVYLGSASPLSSDQRAEFLRKLIASESELLGNDDIAD